MSGDQSPRLPERDRPWMMRTYAGHSTATASNELYRRNLQKGQTGLSVAFDLPTQTGYDPDDELARGEVGKVGVPVSHRGDIAALMDGIPRAGARGADGTGLRADLVLRQRGRPLHRGARQAARDVDPLGGDRPRALRRQRGTPPALPLRRPGELARPHRVPAGEQRPADRARGARRHPRTGRPRPRDPAARVERGARAAAPLGPAVVAADPADP